MYNRILVTLDGSELAEEVIPYAEDIGTKMKSEIILLRVSPPVQALEENGRVISTVDQEMERVAAEYNEYLSRIAFRFRSKGLKTRMVVRFGDPAEQIVDFAKDDGIDLITMCTHGRSGVSRWVYGSVADRVLRAASMPVLLIRASIAKPE